MITTWRHLSSKIKAKRIGAVASRISFGKGTLCSGRNEIIRHEVWIRAKAVFQALKTSQQHSYCSLLRFVEDMPIPVLGLDLKYGPRRDLLLDRLRDALLHQEPRCTTVNHFEF